MEISRFYHPSVADPTEQQCKGCGLSVQLGYPKCPRCKMPMKQSPRATAAKGGTAALDESEGSMWMTIVAVGLLAGTLVLVLWLRNSDSNDASSRAAAAEEIEADTSPPDTAPGATSAAATTAAVEDSAGGDFSDPKDSAVSSLKDRLDSLRLWSAIDTNENIVVISTSFCSDPLLKESIEKTRAVLKRAGLESVRCDEKHGAVAFEESL